MTVDMRAADARKRRAGGFVTGMNLPGNAKFLTLSGVICVSGEYFCACRSPLKCCQVCWVCCADAAKGKSVIAASDGEMAIDPRHVLIFL